MEHIESTQISELGIKLKRKGDLLYHEGPLLSHFINENNTNENYFYKWTDCDDTCNRWLIFRVSVESLKSFFQEKYTLLELILENSFVYFMDLDNNLNQKKLVVCSITNIPTDYLPTGNSYFKEKQYEKYSIELKSSLMEQPNLTQSGKEQYEIILQEVSNIKANQENQTKLLKQVFSMFLESLKKEKEIDYYSMINLLGIDGRIVNKREQSIHISQYTQSLNKENISNLN